EDKKREARDQNPAGQPFGSLELAQSRAMCGSRAAAVSVFRPWLESASPIAPSPARASVRPLLRCRLAWRKRRGHRPLGVVAINCLPLNEFFAADHDFVQCTNACCNAA